MSVIPKGCTVSRDTRREIGQCLRKKGYSLKMATRIAAQRGLRVYACPWCPKFHLTKQDWTPGL